MQRLVDAATSIKFWEMVEAKARMVICSIQYGERSGNDVAALHSEGIADLKSNIDVVELTLRPASKTTAIRSTMEFKDLPYGVQLVAAQCLAEEMTNSFGITQKESGPAKEQAHKFRDAFIELYSHSEFGPTQNDND